MTQSVAVQPFTTLIAPAAPYFEANVNTDLIIRAERCVGAKREDLGLYAFEAVRYDRVANPVEDSKPNPDFVFNREPFRRAQVLVGGDNFGCGSSREMAVWALMGMGIRCVIAPSFGEIFFNNCFQNGVLAIRLPRREAMAVAMRLESASTGGEAAVTMTVDLPTQRITMADGNDLAFPCDPYLKRSLIEGRDAIAMTLAADEQTAKFQAADKARRPWIYLDPRRWIDR